MSGSNSLRRKASAWSVLRDALPLKRRHAVMLFLLSVVSNLLMLVGPVFMLQIYDRVLISRSTPTLAALTGLIVVLFGFYAAIEWLRARMTARIAMLAHQDLAPSAFRSAVLGGARKDEPLRDLDTVRGFIAGHGPLALMDLPWLPVYMGLIFLLHPFLGWVATAGAIVMAVLLVVSEWVTRAPGRAASAAVAERQAIAEDARSNVDAIVAMGMMRAITSRFLAASDRMVESQRLSSDQTAFFASFGKSFRLLLQSLVLAAGAYLVINGELSPGLMLAASVIVARALAPIEMLVANWKGFVASRQALGRLAEQLGGRAPQVRRTALPRPSKSVLVTNLVSGPAVGRPPIVFDIGFSLEAGQGLGIIGASGSGKSTIARAITGIWPALRGDVRFDGAERDHYDPEVLGRAIGYLPQEVELFDGTIAENISRFEQPTGSAGILAAAKASGTHQLIAGLPDGYDTRIGPRGTALSAGQRQRVGLARALYGDPMLLVLDEPNANLDHDGELALVEALGAAKSRGAIVILVAHRPSAIVATEKLLFVANGRQVAYGDREDVLKRVLKQPLGPAEVVRSHG